MNDIPMAYDHQKKTTDFIVANPKCMITSDPGTGKTRAVLDAHAALGGRTLVIAPLSICLLYTSPSPRDLSTSRMPSSA
mgnify:CR=1 FL=1